MGKSRMKAVAAICTATLLLGGCGEAPYELTQSEESLIVNYAAHVVAKFNVKQKDGITYVDPSKLQPQEETETELAEETPQDTSTETTDGTQNAGEGGQPQENAEQTGKTLQDLFGTDGLSVSYTGYDVNASYVEEDYYSLNAPAGSTYVILNVNVANNTGQDITLDNLSKKPSFKAMINGEEVPAETTILLTDFSTYQGTIAAGQSVNTVLIFKVNEETGANITDMNLEVNVNGEKTAVIL